MGSGTEPRELPVARYNRTTRNYQFSYTFPSKTAWNADGPIRGRRSLVGDDISFISHALNFIIIALGILLILTILIQRGKGGGLIGAFGGAGGSSPFGSKAGDTFTRITITMAGIWVLLIMIHIKVVKGEHPAQRNAQAEIVRHG